jgi:hypothetical protein
MFQTERLRSRRQHSIETGWNTNRNSSGRRRRGRLHDISVTWQGPGSARTLLGEATMCKPIIELEVLSPNGSAPLAEPLATPSADCRAEGAFVFDRWEQRGEDRTRQTSSYCIHITLPGRTS